MLDTTHHIERWRYDLELLSKTGINQLCYPIPWHRIERQHGTFDFEWLDAPMKFMEQNGMRPIVAEPDIFGLDYYALSEIDWRWSYSSKSSHFSWPVSSPRGFAAVALDYSSKYQKLLMLTETNVRGTVTGRITW